MIEQLVVHSAKFNTDWSRPTTFWPQTSWQRYQENERQPFALADGLLPERHELALGKGMYAVLGPNECGKSTLLKAIAWGMENARHFEAHQRTARYAGTLGIEPSSFATKSEGVVTYDPMPIWERLYRSTHGYEGFTPVEKPLEVSLLRSALLFYLGQEEFFIPRFVRTYDALSDERVAERMGALFATRMQTRDAGGVVMIEPQVGKEAPDHVKALFESLAKETGKPQGEVARRVLYLLEQADLMARVDVGVNRWGEVGLKLDRPVQEQPYAFLSKDYVPAEHTSKSSGGYARSRLVEFMGMDKGEILLLDEPDANLDVGNRFWFSDTVLPALAAKGSKGEVQAFVVTHDPRSIERLRELGVPALDMMERPMRVLPIDIEKLVSSCRK